MRIKERLSCAVGNIFNDLFRQLAQSYELFFLMKIVELSPSEAALIILIGQIADASFSPIAGYLGDSANVPFLSKKIGRRKSWHCLATVFMAIGLPFFFNRCLLCSVSNQNWLRLFYFCFISALINICFNVVEINHLAFITTVAASVEECTVLSAMRTVFSFLSGVFIYATAWGLLGLDSGDASGPNSPPYLTYLSWIATGTGVFFAIIFLIGAKEPQKLNEVEKQPTCVGNIEDHVAMSDEDGKNDENRYHATKEPQRRLRTNSTYSSTMNAAGMILTLFESKNTDSSRDSLAYRFVGMTMASSQFETCHYDLNGSEDIRCHEQRERKKNLLQKFVPAILNDEGNDSGHSQSKVDAEGADNNQESENTKKRICSEAEHLDRERKKSLLSWVYDGILSRMQHPEERQTTCTGSIGHQAAEGSKYDGYITGAKYCRKEEVGTIPEEKHRKTSHSMDSSKKGKKIGNDDEKVINDIFETSISFDHGQSEYGHPTIPDEDDRGLPNFGSTYDTSADEVKGDFSNTSIRKPKKAVTFSAPLLLEIPSIREDQTKELDFYDMAGEATLLNESARNYLRQSCKNNDTIVSYERSKNYSSSEANPDLHSPHVSSENFRSERKHPKRIKDWLRDPNLYKVAIIFTCTRLAQDTVYSYLPLFLSERLKSAKEAIAYIPLILLVSGSLSSLICNRLCRKIGSKWSFLLAAFLVMGGAVWSYFLTVSPNQSTYAPVVMIGSGLSVMYVMALVFITELIGENKETSGSVFAIVTVIARISSGGLIICIQEFYPEESSNMAVGNYVQYVFAMTPGTLTLVGSMLVLLFQPSEVSFKNKGSQSIEDQADQSSCDGQVPQCTCEIETTPNVCLDENQNSSSASVLSFSEDTKL